MYTHEKNGRDLRKLADLTVDEVTSLFLSIQTKALEKALEKLLPKKDPDEEEWWTTQQVADRLGLSRQTIQKKKADGLIEFDGEGRTTRFTIAAVKRYLKRHGLLNHSIEKQVENPVRKRYKRKKKSQ